MRLHQPVGIWLVLLPCLWVLMGVASPYVITLFVLGSVLMRSAGCILNDILDRKFDAHVARTRLRPMASGEVSVREAVLLVVMLLTLALLVLLQLKPAVWGVAIIYMVCTASYPLMKRFFPLPQLFLGITFNGGVLMADMQLHDAISSQGLLFYLAAIAWTFGYDTIYALQDAEDDKKLSLRSSVLTLGAYVKPAIALSYVAMVLLLLCTSAGRVYYGLVLGAAALLLWQVVTLQPYDRGNCARRFKANTWVGVLVMLGMLAVRGLQ